MVHALPHLYPPLHCHLHVHVSVSNSGLLQEYQQELFQLKEEFERYKTRAQSVLKTRGNKVCTVALSQPYHCPHSVYMYVHVHMYINTLQHTCTWYSYNPLHK